MMLKNTVAARRKLKDLPFNKIAPNMVTLFALCAGVSSISYSAQAKWEHAVIAVFIAAIFDGLDGRVARLLRGTTKFGAELDSLSDFVSFGVAPAILVYFWTMKSVGGIGWVLCLMFSMCMALRLARFNTMLDAEPAPHYWSHFFVGVPAPAAAVCALIPVMLNLEFGSQIFKNTILNGSFLFIISCLMVSHIPTVSLKKLRIPVFLVVPVMLMVALYAGFIVSQPWLTISVSAIVYLLSIPAGVYMFFKFKKEELNK